MSGVRRGWRKDGWLDMPLTELVTKLLSFLPAMCSCALADELAVRRSPDPFGAAASTPSLVVGVFTVRMVAGINGEHFNPNFSEILLESLDWGKSEGQLYSDCTVLPGFFRLNFQTAENKQISNGGGGGSRVSGTRSKHATYSF